MAIKFKGDLTKVIAKNKGDLTKTSMRQRAGIAAASGGSSSSGSSSSSDIYTKMLLHFDDDATATTFADAAQSPLTQTKFGTVATSTAQSKFGGKSLALDGTNTNKLQFANPNAKAMDLSNKPFCVESWFYLTSYNTTGDYISLMSWGNADNGDRQGVHPALSATNQFAVFMTTNGSSWDLGGPSITTSVSLTLNTWFHLALIRETVGGDIKLVHNGVVIGTKATTASLYTGDYFYVGKTNWSNNTRINGYVDDVRVVVGSCPYSASAFVVPTAELTATADTKLLIKGSTTIKDESSLNLYTQALGSAASSTVQSKFGGSSIKIASATGDFIKVYNNTQPIALLDRDFTIEGWFYFNQKNVGYQPLLGMYTDGDMQGFNMCHESGSGQIVFAYLANGSWGSLNSGVNADIGSWHHIAVTRSGTSLRFFFNGQLKATNTLAAGASFASKDYIFVGYYQHLPGGAKTFNGYIDEVRITLDYCAYNSNFTPISPTTQLSASANTKLMLNFNSDSNDSSTNPSTVTAYGGAVLSSDQSKFGGKSMKFTRSTGSRLTVSNVGNKLQFGSSDFCIETWLYLNSMPGGSTYPSGYWIMGYGADLSPLGFDYWIGTTNIICAPVNYDYATQPINVAHGMTTNRWYHVALSRNGGTLNLFIDGFLKGSGSISGAIYTIPSTGANANAISIGSGEPGGATSGNFDGYMDDFRITIGEPVYLPNFTPPTAPFTLIG